MREQLIIEKYFLNKSCSYEDVVVGIGDDAAVLNVPDGQQLVTTTDTLNAGVHFLHPDNMRIEGDSAQFTSAFDIGYKSAAVNISDLAAMGAKPAWATLSLSLPNIDEPWLNDFSEGIFSVLNQFNVALVGGDLTRGPLSITVTANGLIPEGQAILRAGAQQDDLIYVSGSLGAPSYALSKISDGCQGEVEEEILVALNHPIPRVELGLKLRGLATAGIDISDGLIHDLRNILSASKRGAVVDIKKLPIAQMVMTNVPLKKAYEFAASGGDEYELCFTVNPNDIEKIENISKTLSLSLTQIGKIISTPGVTLLNNMDKCANLETSGFEHFV